MDPLVISGVLGIATLIVLVLALLKIVALGKLTKRLSERIEGTGMTAKELADELGGSIDEAFGKYVPKPEQLAAALTGAVENAGRQQLSVAEELNKAIGEAAKSLQGGLTSAGKEATELLENTRKALADTTGALTTGFEGCAGKFQSVFGGHAEEVQNALQGIGGVWKDQIAGILSEHAQKLSESNTALAAELDKIAALEKDIVKVLHVQETIEGTLKEIAASEEFKATLEELRTHLQESDQLLREAAKPRTIRLVEADDDIVEA